MKFTPSGNRILVKPDDAEKQSAGGILLPDTAKEKPRRGKVLAKGPGKLRDDGTYLKIPLDEGDSVVYDHYTVSKVEIEREEMIVIDFDQVLGIVS